MTTHAPLVPGWCQAPHSALPQMNRTFCRSAVCLHVYLLVRHVSMHVYSARA